MYFESVCNKILSEIFGKENLKTKELNVKNIIISNKNKKIFNKMFDFIRKNVYN